MWVDDVDGSLVIQGWKLNDTASAEVNASAPIPEHETVLRIGDGAWVGEERVGDPELAKACVASFDAVWDRAIPNEEY